MRGGIELEDSGLLFSLPGAGMQANGAVELEEWIIDYPFLYREVKIGLLSFRKKC